MTESNMHCKCGTPLAEVEFIPGTEACSGCHELLVMKETRAIFAEPTGRPHSRGITSADLHRAQYNGIQLTGSPRLRS
jgi:hypothetical protein